MKEGHSDWNSLVLDTSVWINLLATEEATEIVATLGCECLVPDAVKSEVLRNPVTGVAYPLLRHPLTFSPSMVRAEMTEAELSTFLELVGTEGSFRLGDGEAAAIAVAVHRRVVIAIDERKARNVLRTYYPKVQTIYSIDLLRHQRVLEVMGEDKVEGLVAKAKQFGRMHVPIR
ncbi:MAG: hypothetical protein FD152_1419 [Xanthobacteraceae bacterium]|nr:MAG: hypothetical protein FD152_1419 [Xanthobacteraceae bacterium]